MYFRGVAFLRRLLRFSHENKVRRDSFFGIIESSRKISGRPASELATTEGRLGIALGDGSVAGVYRSVPAPEASLTAASLTCILVDAFTLSTEPVKCSLVCGTHA
jgi:hypothetical protein